MSVTAGRDLDAREQLASVRDDKADDDGLLDDEEGGWDGRLDADGRADAARSPRGAPEAQRAEPAKVAAARRPVLRFGLIGALVLLAGLVVVLLVGLARSGGEGEHSGAGAENEPLAEELGLEGPGPSGRARSTRVPMQEVASSTAPEPGLRDGGTIPAPSMTPASAPPPAASAPATVLGSTTTSAPASPVGAGPAPVSAPGADTSSAPVLQPAASPAPTAPVAAPAEQPQVPQGAPTATLAPPSAPSAPPARPPGGGEQGPVVDSGQPPAADNDRGQPGVRGANEDRAEDRGEQRRPEQR